jgi:hypothetical protein
MNAEPETPRSNVAALDVVLSSQLSEPLYEEAMTIVARLESQNQALQERADGLERAQIVFHIAADADKAEIKALQERIEEARKYVTENGAVMMNTPATWRRFVDEILQLLSPTQETDPE